MLKPLIRSLEQEENEFAICLSRKKSLRNKIEELFPEDIDATIYFSNNGKDSITVSIELPLGISEKNTERCRHFLVLICGSARRVFREDVGSFMWYGNAIAKDENGNYTGQIIISNVHPGQCKIIAKKKEVIYYETDCKAEDNNG